MGSIVVQGSGGEAGPVVDRLERLADADPQPGSYWRSKDDVPEKRRDRASAGFMRSDPLRTWSEVARAALPGGRILLLQSTHKVDGMVHTLVTAGEPSIDGDPDREWLADEFFAHMEPVSEADARRDRDLKAERSLARIAEIQGEMAGIASRVSEDATRLLPPPGSQRTPSTPAAFTDARQRAERNAVAVKAQADAMQEASQSLSRETSRLVAIQSERARAAVASVQDALRLADAATKAAETLDVFGGKKVEIVALREGEPAPPEEPVALYQNRLFLDEELAIFLHKSGFDHRDVEALPRIVARHPELVDRMIPARRGVALVRIRRGDKRYVGHDASLVEILGQIEMQRADKDQFLLVRDGERLSLVFVEVALQDAVRLFPTVDEMDRPFRGSDGVETIGFDDTRYVKALGEFERQALVYKRLLVLLWGLQFNDAAPMGHVGKPGETADWYSAEWQSRNLLFVYDDATRSLPDARPDIHSWIAANVATIDAGSRVVVRWDRAITPETAPSCASYHGDNDRTVHSHLPKDPISIATVRRQAGELVVEVPVARRLHKGRESFTATVALSRLGDIRYEPAFLVLDSLDPDDFEHYMESRISRVHYLDYLALFAAARKALAVDFADIRRIDGELADDMGPDLPGVDAATLASAVTRAHRMWRSESAGRPATTASERAEVKSAAALIATGTPTEEGILAVTGLAREDVLFAGVTGRGRVVVLTDGPDDPLLRDGAWVTRHTFRADRKGRWQPHARAVENLFRSVDPGIDPRIGGDLADRAHAGRLPEGVARPADTAAILATLAKADPSSPGFVDTPQRMLAAFAERSRHWTYRQRPRGTWGVVSPSYASVIGAVACLKGRDGRPALRYLGLTADVLALAVFDDPRVMDDVVKFHQGIYKDGGPLHCKAIERRVEQARGNRDALFDLCGLHPDLVHPGLKAGLTDFAHHYSFDRVNEDAEGGWRAIARTFAVSPNRIQVKGGGWRDDPAPLARLVANVEVMGWLERTGRLSGDRPEWFDLRAIPLA